VMTDTLFIFVLSISIWFFFRFADDKKGFTLLLALISLVFAGLVRGIGFLLLIPATGWCLYMLFKDRSIRLAITMFFIVFICVIPFVITFSIVPVQQKATTWKNNTISGEILKGLLWNEKGRATAGVDICEENLPAAIAKYSRNPFEYIKLMLQKLKTYWWIFTPESSLRHRILSCLFFIPFYFFVTWGLMRSFIIANKGVFLIALVGMFTLASMIGIVDYDLRYHLPVEAILIVFAAYGVQCCLQVVNVWNGGHSDQY